MLKDLINRIVKKTKKVVTLPAVRTSSGEFLLKKTDFGLVRVDFSVIEKIVERTLAQVEGIAEVNIAVEKVTDRVVPLRVKLTMILAEGFSAPKVSEKADKVINDALRNFLQLEFFVPVEVRIKQIEQVVAPKRRRVR